MYDNKQRENIRRQLQGNFKTIHNFNIIFFILTPELQESKRQKLYLQQLSNDYPTLLLKMPVCYVLYCTFPYLEVIVVVNFSYI